jgi:hypothetical protein
VEILRIASLGTEIALGVLENLKKNENTWCSDAELSDFILSCLGHELGSGYAWMDLALHFVCNPLGISDDLIMFLHDGNQALEAIKNDP